MHNLNVGRGQVLNFLLSCWLGDGGQDTCGVPSLNGNGESLEKEWRGSCVAGLGLESASQFLDQLKGVFPKGPHSVHRERSEGIMARHDDRVVDPIPWLRLPGLLRSGGEVAAGTGSPGSFMGLFK